MPNTARSSSTTSTSTRTTSSRSTGTRSGSTTSSGAKASAAKQQDRGLADVAAGYVRETGQLAVDVPVGAVLTVRDRVGGAVEPWTSAERRSRELEGLRAQVRSELDRFERRGGEARRSAGSRVRAQRTRVREQVESVPATVRGGRERVEGVLRRARDTVRRTPSSTPAA